MKLSKAFFLSSPIVSAIASILLAAAIFTRFEPYDRSAAIALLIWGAVAATYAAVVMLILCYRMWQSIYDNYARMSPGRAVGFLFIPLFNLYWIFQVLWGFAKDYNSYISRNSINTRRLPEGLFLAWVILPLTLAIPYLNIAAAPAYWVVSGIAVSKICDAVNALVHGQTSQPDGALLLYFLSGEFRHDKLEIPPAGLYIGRDPARANLVFSSNKISSLHLHLAPDRAHEQLWVEDLNSLNGTFYLQSGASGDPGAGEWIRLKGKTLLSAGAQLRLADDVAEFEIRRV